MGHRLSWSLGWDFCHYQRCTYSQYERVSWFGESEVARHLPQIGFAFGDIDVVVALYVFRQLITEM